ncbi:MAG: hypothetical protein ACPGJV_08920 [Bacteriovoracaceae bacterium]
MDKRIKVNDIWIEEVIIDPHVDKHSDHIDDNLILSLVELLHGKSFVPTVQKDGFAYFLTRILFEERVYRLVWLQESCKFYIGVITSFKEKGAKHDIP